MLRAAEPPDYSVTVETALRHDDGKILWFHPRATSVPGGAVMALQHHLKVSDYYSGLHVLTRTGLDGAWRGPFRPPV